MPFDQFTIEQLAGDLLEKPSEDQLIATAFNRNHMLNAEGGTIPEENRTKNVLDRVETTSGVWLGLTFQCCQCHDHKFDPLKQSDYYSMYALFNQLSEPGGVNKRFGKKEYSDEYDKLCAIESPYISVGIVIGATHKVNRLQGRMPDMSWPEISGKKSRAAIRRGIWVAPSVPKEMARANRSATGSEVAPVREMT